ncbi:hypothetical protein ASE63_08265 [Bosea sp. Root381]|uniref:hypothetical protein n=1 Tax=Bosea sp. Root381 TaxID=1736524 RepID=UPI000701430A|nr:hypothetical protein [Bosea sp. Root381]KRE00087.1 hypothetical protein ASE63_08265 [Bosea sp. Root381]
MAAAITRLDQLSELERESRRGTSSAPLAVSVRKRPPISLADYKVPGDTGGAGGGSSRAKLDAYEKELIQIEKRTKALHLEADMVGKSTFEREKARAALELETAAKKANIPITDEMRLKIEQAATGYANAKVRVEEVTRSLEAAQEAQRFFGDAITDSLSDLILNGEKAEDVLKNLIKQLAKAALQAALMGSGPLAGIFGTAGSNGNVGGLIGGLISGFREKGGPVSAGKAYVVGEKRPEVFVPNTAGRILPRIPSAAGGRSSGSLTLAPTYQIDARGSQMSEGQFRAILAQNNAMLKAEMPGLLSKQHQRSGS